MARPAVGSTQSRLTQPGHSLLKELVTRPLLLLMLARTFIASHLVGD